MDGPAITTHHLTRRHGARLAVDDVDLEVPAGALVGLVGPNGAGKTTLMAMALGLVRPTSGTLHVLGRSPRRAGPLVGGLVEAPAFHPGLTGAQNLAYLARLGGHDVGAVPRLLDRVGLADRGDDRYATYSLGMRQRLGIASALVGDPQVVVLDEPSNGVDPAGAAGIRAVLTGLVADGRTVLVSSHLLADLEQVCTWLVVLDRGRVLHAGPPEALPAPHERLVLRAGDPRQGSGLREVLARFGEPVVTGDLATLDVGGRDVTRLAAEVNLAAHHAGVVLAEVRREHVDLESRYLALVGQVAR